ncbi:MAG: metalloregulator ArsR/SmtB family transcription factor [Nitrososphaerales archaeon]|nr:metalloregulator ArsR/SmtB family transcription factor [Nitrososphaerales archaeon]
MSKGKSWEMYEAHAEFCKTFSHPIRLAILDSFRDGEKTVSQLQKEIGVRQSTVSQQLSFLRRLGIVKPRREGRLVYYKLTDQRVFKAYDLVDQVVRETRFVQAKIVT